MFKKGTIVLIPFPFTDLSGDKVRPVLIVGASTKGDDVIVCMISSIPAKKLNKTNIEINVAEKDFLKTGLRGTSYIKVHKIATLDKKLILGELGSISSETEQKVHQKLIEVFGLK